MFTGGNVVRHIKVMHKLEFLVITHLYQRHTTVFIYDKKLIVISEKPEYL